MSTPGNSHSLYSSLLGRRGLGRRGSPTAQSQTLRSSRKRLHLERLEDRLLMDGAGFVHTNPEPDPDSIVGVAGIEAQDDYVRASLGTQQLRIDVLKNDPLPEEAESLRIKSVSKTAKGATVSVSDDGKRIVYTPPEGGVTSDSFYYIVEDDTGELGKANVTVDRTRNSGEKLPTITRYTSRDRFSVLEDSSEQTLDVLANDRNFSDGEIIEVTSSNRGTVRIADDGKSLLYQPNAAETGYDSFQYTVRADNGDTAYASVRVRVQKPYQIVLDSEGYTRDFSRDIGTGPHRFDLLANDSLIGPTSETPRIVDVEVPGPAGQMRISEDGQSVIIEPAEGFLGNLAYSYTVRYGALAHQTVEGSGLLLIQNTFLAVDNWFAVDVDSDGATLDVLANDPTLQRYRGGSLLPEVTLGIVGVSAGDQNGVVTVSEDGKSLRYRPAAGFVGNETFSYTVEDSNGYRDSATVTVNVAEQLSDAGVPKFILPGELEQFLIDQAVERFKGGFGVTQRQYVGRQFLSPSWNYLNTGQVVAFDTRNVSLNASLNADRSGNSTDLGTNSETNTQEVGVDEADIVETDGHYVYTFSNGKLVIVDVSDPEDPQLVSYTAFDDRYEEMYLQGDRITLIQRGGGRNNPAIVTVLDIADRAQPIITERTEIAGRIIDSRAVGDRVFVAVSGLDLPPLESTLTQPAGEGDYYGYRTTETLDEYVARVRDTLLETALPTFQTFDAAGELIASGLVTDSTQIHKPIDATDNALLSLATFDVGDGNAGPDSATGIFASQASEVYMSGNSFYVLQNDAGGTTIFKFSIDDDGEASLAATGKVAGTLLNQFSVDEHEGRLRIVVTENRADETGRARRPNRILRQERGINNILVLEQDGAELNVVGRIDNLAPTETIKSVRFLGDQAYVVTARVIQRQVIDPLFVIDLSDPTDPQVTGALTIPGYSDYLHPVGEDYVIGIGRDSDEITGWIGPLQISLFFTGGEGDPTVVDQFTMVGAEQQFSEAWNDHRAVAYFAEEQVLTIPISWSESISKDTDDDGIADWWGTKSESAIWAFGVEVDGQGGGSLEVAGSVEHSSESASRWSRNSQSNPARRSVRVGENLITLSNDYLKINRLDDVSVQLSEVYLGTLPQNDQFTIEEDSQEVVLDVRANDRLGVDAEAPKIVSVSQPTRGNFYGGWGGVIGVNPGVITFGAAQPLQLSSLSVVGPVAGTVAAPWLGEPIGTVEIAEDGTSLIFTPRENFFGTATFTYTVFDEIRGEQQATVTVNVTNVPDPIEAVNDDFEVLPEAESTTLNVLANDLNPDQQGYYPRPYVIVSGFTNNSLISSDDVASSVWYRPSVNGLNIASVGPTDNGGVLEIDQWGTFLTYTPASGFIGLETFTYTVTNLQGETDVATVTVRVGDATTEQAFVLPNRMEQFPTNDSIELTQQDREQSFDSSHSESGVSKLNSVLLSAGRPQYRPSISTISLAVEMAWDSEADDLCDVCPLLDLETAELLAQELVSMPDNAPY